MEQSSTQIIQDDIETIVNDIKEFSDKMENKKFLVVGGRGFIGTYFVKVLDKLNQYLKIPMKITVIDNLIKGGSGQAVQNMNVAFNMRENLGLIWKFVYSY